MTTSPDGEAARAVLYDAAGHDREIPLEAVDVSTLGDNQLLWVDIAGHSLSDLPAELASAVRSGPSEHPGSIEIYDNFYRFGVPTRNPPDQSLYFSVGHSWLVTSSGVRQQYFDEFLEADRGETLKGRMTATALMASLLMRHLDEFRKEIARIDLAVDELDETILRSREKHSPLLSLAAMRRKLSGLRSSLAGHRGVIRGLIAPDFLAHVAQTDRDFLVEVNRVFERLEDDVGRARETVIGSFELYASRVAQDTNQLVKVLTIATVITGIVGAVAGIFGMNFDTPIAHSGVEGFILVTGGMILMSIAIVGLARLRGWV